MGQLAEQLPGFDLDGLLHDSSASAVYRAKRLADGARVVVKRTQGNTVSARQLTRYRNEYELLLLLTSDGIVKVHDLLRHQGKLALVLEEFPGLSLKQWRMEADRSVVECLEIAIALAQTIGEVHAAGIIHKDINSYNILYDDASKRIKLIDFGIATRLNTEESKFQFPAALEGTLAYIAPEQTGRMNRSLDYRADWYSFGVTLYELFSGRLPHSSEDPLEAVHFHIAGKPMPLAEADTRVPEAVSDVVMKLLQKAPEDRYQSAAGIVADLRRCVRALTSTGRVDRFALGADDVIERFELPQKLYGREVETATLLTTFERIASGSVEAVLVSGQTGTGKTSLVQEIYQPITSRRGYFAAGKFDQLQQDVPFGALVDALQDLVQQLLTESEESIQRWRAAIQSAVGVNGQIIVDVIPALEHIIGAQPRVPPLPGFEAQNRFKLVFQSFIQVFAKRLHPLVLFLDDMQWADAASLNLVTLILSAPATESLLVVEAYRDNEVSPTHPFMMAVRDQENHGVRIESIALAPLLPDDIARLVCDTLHQDQSTAVPLARVIHAKTGGNPFFTLQFLESLYADKLISFEPGNKSCRYDIAAIEAAAITENVAELLGSKLDKHAPATREVLRLAAAIGGRFDLNTLAIINRSSEAEVAASLQPALADGLIVPASRLESLDPNALDSPLVYRRFAFLHDRVQRAAYDMIAPDERPALHLAIGRVLLSASGTEQLEQRLFDIVNHMNHGVALLDDRTEKVRLAELNIRAGIKARNSTAYSLAVRNFQSAVALLGGEQAWTDHHALACEAHTKLAEGLCLTADYEAAFTIIDSAVARAVAVTDRAKLYALKVITYLSMGQMPEALGCGRRAAEELGMELPEQAEQIERVLQTEIGAILTQTGKVGIQNLLELPLMQEPEKIALMELLTHCLPAAYQTNQQLFALLCCKMVSLSLENGNCPLSSRAYGSFAALLSSVLGRYRDAYRFAKLGVDLAHRLDEPSVYAGVYFLWAMFASHWNEPIDESIGLFKQSVQYGLQAGDHLHAGYSAARRISHQQFKGVPLAELHEDATSALELLERISDFTNISFLEPRIRFIAWLRGERPHGDTLGGNVENEQQCTESIRARGNKSFESDWFMLLAMQRYLCGNFTQAEEFAREAAILLPFSAGFVTRIEHNFYYSLTGTALYETAAPAERAKLEADLAARQDELKAWADNCPENFRHLHLLVEAERARIGGRRLEASDLYDQAIAAAAQHGFIQIEALAAELAARFWFAASKPDFGGLYLERALHAHEIWGALGKAQDLRVAYGLKPRRSLATSMTTPSTTLGGTGERGDSLDLATVLKANQAISGEIVLERLLGKMLDIILENAGAESAVLVLETNGEFLIQGTKDGTSGRTRVMMGEPLRGSVALSAGIVNYVIRTSENVVLADPALRGMFRNDGYVRNRHPKSVLCAPITYKGKLTGVVYLENNQIAGAFTPGRLEALGILMSQIAVSIENATLYTRQEQQARSIEQANTALTKEVAERKHAEQELSRYKDHLEELVVQRTRELESAQGRLVDLSRQAGMAEVASGVLHNVGNVMNSVNVGANVTRDSVKALPVERLGKTCDLLDAHADRIGDYLTSDTAGRRIPEYLRKLAQTLSLDKQKIRDEIDRLLEHLDHMKTIIAAQQSYAKVHGITEVCALKDIAETALAISAAALSGSDIDIVREYQDVPPALFDRHQILQILVNLISNARHALEESDAAKRRLTVVLAADGDAARIEVRDNGVGIPRANLPKVFNHGFTTKKTGHGFGLHNCANAAQQMDGRLEAFSDGPGKGARFVLRLPLPGAADVALEAGAA
ncbi:MAG TPA: AAA family ATPase [Gammaproteobacteria bacterium]